MGSESMDTVGHTLEIGRLVLTDLRVPPERADALRALVETELGRLLAESEWPGGIATSDIARLEAPPLHLAEPSDSRGLAHGLAQNIAQALHSPR